jgi:hypothetical protein
MGAERTICRGLRKLDRPRFVLFLLLLLKMSWTGLRRRGLYFEEERNQEMPQRVLENIFVHHSRCWGRALQRERSNARRASRLV